MKHRLFILTSMTILFVGFFVFLSSTHVYADVSLPSSASANQDLPASALAGVKFNWVDMANIDGTFPNGGLITFSDKDGLSDYYTPNQLGAYTGVTCGGNTSVINVEANSKYSRTGTGNSPTDGELRLLYLTVGAVDGVCNNPNPTNITIGNAAAADIMYTFTSDGLSRVDSATNAPFDFIQNTTYSNLYVLGNSTCADRIVDTGNDKGVLYELTPGTPATGAMAIPANAEASGCIVSGDSTDVLSGGGAGSTTPPTNAAGGFLITLGGTAPPPGSANNPADNGGGAGGSTLNCGTGGGSDFSATSNDACLMPQCEFSITNPITWFICPIVWAGEKLVGQLDNGITGMLNVNTCQYFYDINTTACAATTNCSGGATSPCADTSKAFYAAWSSFRDIALSIVIIASLVMIISQAVGVEAVSAYSFKKMMPRLIIVIIGISLSWFLLEFAVQLSDDLGNGIRFLIYSPFAGLGSTNKDILSGGGQAVTALVISGAGLALGIVGLLTLVLSAAIAVVVGFGLLLVRNLAIIVLIILAPIGIACFALPNTERVWKLWSSNFIKVLLMFPIIAAFIATGRVLSAIIYTNDNSTLDQLMAFVVYFAPYFMIPTAFKLAGGAMAQAGNIGASIRSRANQPLKAARGNIVKDRASRAKNGNLFKGDNRLAKFGSRVSQNAMLANKVGLRPSKMRASLAAERSNIANANAAEAVKNQDVAAILANEDYLNAANHGMGTEADARAYLASKGMTGQDLNQAVASITKAKRAVGAGVFNEVAYMANGGTGTGFSGGVGEALNVLNRVAGNDTAKKGRLLAGMRSNAERAKRVDLYRPSFGNSMDVASKLDNEKMTVAEATETLNDETVRTASSYELANARPNALRILAGYKANEETGEMETDGNGALQRRLAGAKQAVNSAQSEAWATRLNGGDATAVAQAEAKLQQAQHNEKRVLAAHAALTDQSGGASEDNARVLGEINGQEYGVDEKGEKITLGRKINSLRTDDEFGQYRREQDAEARRQQLITGTGQPPEASPTPQGPTPGAPGF